MHTQNSFCKIQGVSIIGYIWLNYAKINLYANKLKRKNNISLFFSLTVYQIYLNLSNSGLKNNE